MLAACKPAEGPGEVAAAASEPVFERAWIRSIPPGMKMTAGYGVLKNDTGEPIELVSFSSPSFHSVSLHVSKEVDGVNRMTEVESLPVQPGESVEMMPGGYHFMLMGPRASMVPGQQVRLEMTTVTGEVYAYDVSVENR